MKAPHDILQGILVRELEKLDSASKLEGMLAVEHMENLLTLAKILKGAPELADGDIDVPPGMTAEEALKAVG